MQGVVVLGLATLSMAAMLLFILRWFLGRRVLEQAAGHLVYDLIRLPFRLVYRVLRKVGRGG
jgi:hypothetical protein